LPSAWRFCGNSIAREAQEVANDYEQRLKWELEIIQQMQYPGYFLIVWDFIRYAREHNIP